MLPARLDMKGVTLTLPSPEGRGLSTQLWHVTDQDGRLLSSNLGRPLRLFLHDAGDLALQHHEGLHRLHLIAFAGEDLNQVAAWPQGNVGLE